MAKCIWQAGVFSGSPLVAADTETTVTVIDKVTGLKASLWEDRDGSADLSNPFNISSLGKVQFYTDPGRYRISATNGGVTQTWDDEYIIDLERVLQTNGGIAVGNYSITGVVQLAGSSGNATPVEIISGVSEAGMHLVSAAGSRYVGITSDNTLRFGASATHGNNARVFTDDYHPNADRLTTPRTITINGDVSGSVSFDGSSDVSITATVEDDSHAHIISNVDGLQSALDSKLDGDATAVAAHKLATARSIALAGDVSGSAIFDGASDITITAQVADDSHAHVIENVDGLQSALDGKLDVDKTSSYTTVSIAHDDSQSFTYLQTGNGNGGIFFEQGDTAPEQSVNGLYWSGQYLVLRRDTEKTSQMHIVGDTNKCLVICSDDGFTFSGAQSCHVNYSVDNYITASTTQAQGEQPLLNHVNVVTTVANENDVVTLPEAGLQGARRVMVINRGENTLQIYPPSGYDLGNGVDASMTLAPGASQWFIEFYGSDGSGTHTWYQE